MLKKLLKLISMQQHKLFILPKEVNFIGAMYQILH